MTDARERIARTAARERVVDPVAMVHQFHQAFGVALTDSWSNEERRRLRRALIREEFREYRDAEDADDPAAVLDALVHLTYVIVGTALEYGMDFAGAFAAVHAANMAKLGPDGKPILRDDGKVLKPQGWKPADLTPFLAAGAGEPRCEGCDHDAAGLAGKTVTAWWPPHTCGKALAPGAGEPGEGA